MNNCITFFLFLLFFLSCSENEEFKYLAVVTKPVDYASGTNATFHGIVENKSGREITESGFILSVRSQDKDGLRLTSDDPNQEILSQSTNYPLLPGKDYYMRAYAVTQGTTIYGNELSFRTSGEVNTGHWNNIVLNNQYGYCQWVNSVFSLGNISYFLLGEDGMYSYNHSSQDFSLTLINNIIKFATYSFVYNGEAFIFSQDRFYKFNPADNTLTSLSAWPVLGDRAFASSFVINNAFYVGLGNSNTGYVKDFWKYTLDTNTWEQIADFPGDFRSFGFSFTLGDRAFTGGGYNLIQRPYPQFEDLWQYNPELNQWTQKESLPTDNDELFDLRGIENAGKGYCFYQKKLWEYDPIYNFWEPMTNLSTDKGICFPILFTYNNKIYLSVLSNYSGSITMNMWSYEK